MKNIKLLLLTGLLGASLGQSALATTGQLHIYVTGSSAFRTTAIAAIGGVLGLGNTPGTNGIISGGGTGNDTGVAGTGNTTFIWEGGSIGGTPVTVCATFVGSVSGIQAVTGGFAIPFMNDSDASSNPSTAGSINNASAYGDILGSTPNANYGTAVPDFTFSDVFQVTTLFNGTYSGNTYATGNDTKVAIATFKYMASTGFPLGSGYTTGVPGNGATVSTASLSHYFGEVLFSGGLLPLAMMTGNTVDQSIVLAATGLNPGSGTRAVAFADTGYSPGNQVGQYYPAAMSGNTVTDLENFPDSTVATIVANNGDGGLTSDANLRTYLTYTISPSAVGDTFATAYYFVTYLGTADAAIVEGGAAGAVELAYNGVNFSLEAIYEGQYTLWSYEHVIDLGLTGTKLTFENNVINAIQGYTTTGSPLTGVGISLNDPNIKVSSGGTGLARSSDFGPVKVNYSY